jgi:hypothetical protein
MKYWHQLSNVEEAIFQIRKIRSQLSVMMDSELIASSNNDEFPETYKDFLYDLSERFENAMDTLNVEFQNLWDVVRNDSFEEEKPELPNDRWNHIVRDLQNWNEQSMASQPNSDDTISLGVLDIDTIKIESVANLNFDFSLDDNMYSGR